VEVAVLSPLTHESGKEKGMSTWVVMGDPDRYPAEAGRLYKALRPVGPKEVIGC
jgi:hypothetical protein